MKHLMPRYARLARLGMLLLDKSDDDAGGSDDDSIDLDGTDDEDDDDSDDDSGGDDEDDEGDDEDEELGPKGQKALDRMKQRVKDERKKRREAEQKLAASQDKDEAARIQREADERATERANQRILKSEIRAAATAAGFHDPNDALSNIDLDQFEVDDDGEFDTEEIAQAVKDVLDTKSYLAAQGGKPKPDRHQGAGKPAKGTARDQFADWIDKQI